MRRILLLALLFTTAGYCFAQNCTTPLRIVVLGSSTAWGNGVPGRDSAWTFRFARYLKANHNTADTVINLAVGGFTTQNIQATGTPPYTVLGNTFSVDVNKNITKAISLSPDAIIINISNDDEGRGFPLSVQVANYLALKQVAAQNNIPLWVATTQPRDNLGTAGATHLRQMKDSIELYFGNKAIDFWTGLASATNQIATAYSAGDGFHFNSAGQEVLFNRVVAKQIPQELCTPVVTPAFQLSSFTVSRQKDSLKLTWITAKEEKTRSFLVEQSGDSLNWAQLSQLTAAGNSNTPLTYTHTDHPLLPRYYRLNMVDSSDNHTYSPVVKGIPDTLYYAPFRLSAFTLSSLPGKIQLNWATLLESNTLTFTVQRSTDSLNWTSVGILTAAGNSAALKNYTHTDNTVTAAVPYFYRLQMNATDNRLFYSTVVKGSAVAVPANCGNPLRIVVLGSSTAWGNGVPTRDSAWTFRFARYLKANHNTADTVINLAVGGFTTQNIQATGTPAYTVLGNTFSVDVNKNITKAISLSPDAIIINISNDDEGRGFPLSVQVANYLALKQAAAQNNIPLWVATTQPRDNLGTAGSTRLRQMKDSIELYFGNKAIDFWTGLASATNQITTAYSAGDGFHFNSAGQELLFNRVVAKQIPQELCTPDTSYYEPFLLSAFTLSSLPGKLQLNWSTLLESHTLTFTVQRSTDSTNWTAVGTVAAAGNSATLKNYTFTDNTVIAGLLYYYRLQMNATDNRHFYSHLVYGAADSVTTTCNTPLRIVVLGSSTAYGDGLPTRDSAWTFRFARYLKANHNTADTVINLAIGGYTTQHIMPDGTPPYTSLGNTFYVDVQHNITKALSLNPDAIIINMPTNDEARGFPLVKTRDNYLALKQLAAQSGVPLWVTTTQPRGNLGYDAAIRLRQMKDTIVQYFSGRSIDFYNGLATSAGFIEPVYNSGDDVHFNAWGQRILFERVVAAAIPDSLCFINALNSNSAMMATTKMTTSGTSTTDIKLYPNPAHDYVLLQGLNGKPYKVEVYNTLGALVYARQKTAANRLNIGELKPGIYFIIINNTRRYKLVKM